ncbi:MAG TPA: histidine phosphatase family protein [Xanthobacteraceae bacterium]|jgi:broad specificity phosphatase PhoE
MTDRAPPAAASTPILYYVRHGETDWNAEGRLQGKRDIALNARGRRQALRCGEILRELFARERRAATEFDYVSSPLVRASATMELARGVLGLDPASYQTDARLAEMSFGLWEGRTYSDLRDAERPALAARERDKWRFAPPEGESYQQLTARVSEWYSTLRCDTVAAAHGGVARALMAHLRIENPDAATHRNIEQGVVYVFNGNRVTRHR